MKYNSTANDIPILYVLVYWNVIFKFERFYFQFHFEIQIFEIKSDLKTIRIQFKFNVLNPNYICI